jgi:hypothetical protein
VAEQLVAFLERLSCKELVGNQATSRVTAPMEGREKMTDAGSEKTDLRDTHGN